jgi:gliding motility-associated-like protein
VDTNHITPNFTTAVNDSCGPYTVTITNTSTSTTSGTPTYQWWFGNGSVFTGTNPPIQNYPDTGLYTITLVMTDTTACHSPDTVVRQVHIFSQEVSAHFLMPDSLCAGPSFTPSGGSINATTTIWYYGNGDTSTAAVPTITYNTIGTYTVTMVALNSGACNGSDTVVHVIKVLPLPIADFSFVPITPTPNTPTSFTNLSTNANRYTWDFGDNTASNEVNPVHQFTKTGNFKVCLTAFNNSNCPSTLCKMVPADVEPELGLPTGFSPNGDGDNDILYVRGAAIVTLDLKIFNRWGQLVFETNSKDKGWDGTFNGQPQPIDAYAFVLNATFIDGSAKVMKGNVTLLR